MDMMLAIGIGVGTFVAVTGFGGLAALLRGRRKSNKNTDK